MYECLNHCSSGTNSNMDTFETFLVLMLAGWIVGGGAWTAAWTADRSLDNFKPHLTRPYLVNLHLSAEAGCLLLHHVNNATKDPHLWLVKQHAGLADSLWSGRLPGILRILQVLILQVPVVHIKPVLH